MAQTATRTDAWNLLTIPSEIRHQIWTLVFAGQRVVRMTSEPGVLKDDCQACQSSRDASPTLPSWDHVFRPLLTCKQIFREARHILVSSFTLHLGMSPFTVTHAPINSEVRHIETRIHVKDDNRMELGVAMKLLGFHFPNLRRLTCHAHMRPPDSYESLCDAISLAAAIVRLGRDKRDVEITLDFDYVRHGAMFNSPYLGEVTTWDSLEDHELVLRDLLRDDAFVRAALAEGEDENEAEQAMTLALWRVARSHEQQWFDKIRRRRLAEIRAAAQAGQATQASTSTSQDDG